MLLAVAGGCAGGKKSPAAEPPDALFGKPAAPRPSNRAHEKRVPFHGGEQSIERFGQEAQDSTRAAVLGAFRGYLAAEGGHRYGAACVHLAASTRESVGQLTGAKSPGSCARTLPKLLVPVNLSIARRQARSAVTRVRVDGRRAFVVYRAPGAKLYMMPLVREGGSWGVRLLAGAILVPE